MGDELALIDCVRRIIECDGSEDEIDRLIGIFLSAVPHPEALNLLGTSDDPAEIVELAMSYPVQQMPNGKP